MAITFARMRGAAAVIAVLIAGCGDDGGATPPPPASVRPGPGATPVAGGGAGSKNLLVEKPHVEDRVACPIPDQPSDPRDGKCDPKAPSCGEHLYCLPLPQGTYCEPCPERDGIRHAFKERDFDAEHNRDPFQSMLVSLGPTPSTGLTRKCPSEDRMIATSYSYSDLKLVGIVAQGTQRKVLMMGGPLGYIIKRGDCVGKEKAFVKDIGTGYVTFQLELEATGVNQRPPEEYSVQLNPKQLVVNEPEVAPPAPAPSRTTITPVVPPPAVLPPRQAPAPGTAPASPPGTAPASAPGTAPASAAPASGGSAAVTPPAEAPPARARK
ncbi:MAG TPA: hypothetical protein VGD37_35245 [Kofleriaceae bacterium]